MHFNVPPLFKIALGLIFLIAGMGYLYKPDLMLKLNKVLRETVLNDSWVALNRRSVGLLLALLVGVGVHWLQGDAPEGSPPPQVAPAASVAESSGPLAVQAEEHPSARPVEARAGGSPVASGTDLRHGSAPGAAIQDVSAPASRPVAATIREAPARRGSMLPAGKEPAVAQVSVASPVLPPPGAVMTAPHLRVTEIFPAVATGGLMALVNGLPVMEGTRVDDALVKEVRAGEVLFEIDGRSVAVPLRPGE
jgi:hypothetical protein